MALVENIVTGGLATDETGLIVFGGEGESFFGADFALGDFGVAATIFGEINAGLGGEFLHGFLETNALNFHHESENVAAFVGGKIVPDAFFGRNHERWGLINTPRRVAFERAACAL